MKSKHYLLCALSLVLLSITFFINASEELDNVTMKLSTKDHKRGNRVHMHSQEVIHSYMLDNGDITQEEIDKRKKLRKEQRDELKQLRKEGNNKAFKARLSVIKRERKTQRKKMDQYIKNHKDLKQRLNEQRKNAVVDKKPFKKREHKWQDKH